MATQVLACRDQAEMERLARMIRVTLANLPYPLQLFVTPIDALHVQLSGPEPVLALIEETFEALKLEWAREHFELLLELTPAWPRQLKKGESSRPKLTPLRLPKEDGLGL